MLCLWRRVTGLSLNICGRRASVHLWILKPQELVAASYFFSQVTDLSLLFFSVTYFACTMHSQSDYYISNFYGLLLLILLSFIIPKQRKHRKNTLQHNIQKTDALPPELPVHSTIGLTSHFYLIFTYFVKPIFTFTLTMLLVFRIS